MAVDARVEEQAVITASVAGSAAVAAGKSDISYLKGDKGDKGDRGPAGPTGSPGQDGVDGEDGFSPVITSSEITGGHRLSITDAEGTSTVDVMDGVDGADGQDGTDGQDGVSPSVSVTTITGGHQVSITDAQGTDTFNVMDGADGVGIPTAGTTGQFLKKKTNTNYDVEWGNVEALPTGGTTSQVLAKKSNTNFDVEWITPDPGVDPATAAPLVDGTAAVGSSVKYAREDHVHPTDTSRASATTVSGITQKIASISVPYADWIGNGPYSQTVTITGATITSSTKVDIQPDTAAFTQIMSDGISAMFIENNNGTLTLYAIGAATTADITIQVSYYETA